MKNKYIPELRFPEFKKDGEWEDTFVEENCLVKGRIGYRGYTTQDIVEQGKGALVLGGKHIQNQLLHLIDPTFLSWEKYYESPEIMVKVGDIIFSQRGTLGDCAIIDKEIGPATINPSMVLLKNITCDARFLYYILIGDSIQNEVRKNRAMGAIPMLSQKQIKEFCFLIPNNPKEQKKIAACLSSLDELISAHCQKIEALKAHKKGLMQNLFPQEGETVPKWRFVEFVKDGEWVEAKLENYIELFSGIALKSEELSDDESGIPILRGINITEGYIRHSKEIDKYFMGDLESLKKYLIRENDIVIGMDGSKVGKNVALIKKEDENSILIQRVARIRNNKKSDIKYIYNHFVSDKFRGYVDTVNTSSGIPHISAQQIKDFKIGFPPKIKEQQKIALCLSNLDAMITNQKREIEFLKLHKKGLMQNLFPKVTD